LIGWISESREEEEGGEEVYEELKRAGKEEVESMTKIRCVVARMRWCDGGFVYS